MKTRFGKALFAAAAALAMLSAAPECLADGDEARSSEEAILRLINSRSSGIPKAYAAAAERVASEAEDGKPLQQFVIALVSREQRPPPAARLSDEVRNRYLAQSRGKIRALAERRDNALAWYLLSLESNDMQLLKRAVDAQNVQALNAWGTIAIAKKLNDPNVNTNDLVRILYQSYSCFKTAADRHDANGLYNLGMCYMHGYGVQPDPFRALECFRAAAAEDHPEAINNIGGFYRDVIVVERDPIIAARWFAKGQVPLRRRRRGARPRHGRALVSRCGRARLPAGDGELRRVFRERFRRSSQGLQDGDRVAHARTRRQGRPQCRRLAPAEWS